MNTFAEEPPQPPTIIGARNSYEKGDMVKLRCIPRRSNSMKSPYDIAFYIAGKPVSTVSQLNLFKLIEINILIK